MSDSDIVDRLRKWDDCSLADRLYAADEIERLRTLVARYEAIPEHFLNLWDEVAINDHADEVLSHRMGTVHRIKDAMAEARAEVEGE
jgi:hypothetical protein